jgi:hypothetical protein
MAEEKPNKWTRPRSFWEINGGDILMLATALFFLAMMVAGVYVYIFQPSIPGLKAVFSDSAPPGPPPNQKLHLAPGETEMPSPPKRRNSAPGLNNGGGRRR